MQFHPGLLDARLRVRAAGSRFERKHGLKQGLQGSADFVRALIALGPADWHARAGKRRKVGRCGHALKETLKPIGGRTSRYCPSCQK